METNNYVNVTINFNDEMDDGEVQDFLDRALSKYQHHLDVVRNYDYWYDD
jgi:hypothetical protein